MLKIVGHTVPLRNDSLSSYWKPLFWGVNWPRRIV